MELLEKHGKKLHVTPARLQRADRWFERWGAWAVFFSRMLPIVRTFISLPAGVAKMPFWRFTLLTLAGCIPWVFLLTFIGREAGDNWEKWKSNLHYVDYVVLAAIVLGAVWLLVRRRPRWGLLIAATAPPALAGLAFERPIETHLGGPRSIAAGLLAGSAAMALADRVPVRRITPDVVDGLWL